MRRGIFPELPLRSTSPGCCGWAVKRRFLPLLYPLSFSPALWAPLVPRGAFSEPAVIHAYWQQKAGTSEAYVTGPVKTSQGSVFRDKDSESKTQTTAIWWIANDTKKWRRSARSSPPPILFFPSLTAERHTYILYTCTPTWACPGKIITAPTAPHTLQADGEKNRAESQRRLKGFSWQ